MKKLVVMATVVGLLIFGLAYAAFGQTIAHGIALGWTWTGSGTATYNVYRATVAGGEAQPPYATGVTGTGPCVEGAATLTTPCWTDPAPVVGTKYFYTVTAVVGGIESVPSAEVYAQIALPSSPTNPQTAAH